MNGARIEPDLHGIARARSGARVGAYGQRARLRFEVEHDFGAEHFAHRDVARESDLVAALLEREPLGAYTDHDAIDRRLRGAQRGSECERDFEARSARGLTLAGLREIGGE